MEQNQNQEHQSQKLWQEFHQTPTVENQNALVMHYLGFVEHVANTKFPAINRSQKLLPHDLVNSGVVGLIQAIRNYDPNKGSFLCYCYHRVKGEMREWLRALSSQPTLDEKRVKAREDRELENRDEVERLLQGLSDIEKFVAYEYHGLEKRMEVIASETGLSRHQVGRINRSATTKLQKKVSQKCGLAGADHEMVLLGVKASK